jgi:arginyl-tRNA synthetase
VLHLKLEERLRPAIAAVLPAADLSCIQVRPTADAKFGDYQTTSVMTFAKERKMNPRQLATDVLAKLDVSEWCEKVEIAGAGFLNFRIKDSAVAGELESALQTGGLFFERTTRPRAIVIDFSSPNVAKPMHVGHIRSTILGESLARVLRLLGHRVITDNHLGDWGTQFGMLIVGWKQDLERSALEQDPIGEMERLYKKVNAAAQSDPAIRDRARQELVQLQRGDPTNLAIWREMIALSQVQFDTIYQRLGVKFDHTLGESFYNPHLQRVVDDLCARGIARESEGALAVFFEDVPALKEQPALVRKSDGGFNYTTTDLATLEYRLTTWKPDEIVYVTDGRQQLHFQQLFAAFRKWRPDANLKLAHVWFGSILGEDGKPFKTRSGETVKLADLLDEAEERAFTVVSTKNPTLPEEQRREIARIVGIGAVKYADLLPNRQSDYVFSWEKMLALDGNTAVYLLYAYARIRSIFRKGEVDEAAVAGARIILDTSWETNLAKHLLQFGLVLDAVAVDYRPNLLSNYLYDLARLFAGFFENCPVLQAPSPLRESRIAVCALTGRILKQGLYLLGIETLEQM